MIDKERILKNLAEMEDDNRDIAQIAIKLTSTVVLDEVRCRTFEEARRYISESHLAGVDGVSLIVAPTGERIEDIEARMETILKDNQTTITY